MKVQKFIIRKKWEQLFARNLPIWHNTLSFLYEDEGFRWFGLPSLKFVKVCKGFNTVFYTTSTGAGSLVLFRNKLEKQLLSKGYSHRLKRLYNTKCRELLRAANSVHLHPKSLERFFILYGRANALLNVTQVASKVLTDRIVAGLPNPDERAKAIIRYAQPKRLAPIQRLERELSLLAGKKKTIEKDAYRLYRKYAWIPANFVGEPWDISYFIKRIRSAKPVPESKTPPAHISVSRSIQKDLQLLGLVTELNEYRKEVFSQVNFRLRPFWGKLAKQNGLRDWRDICLLSHDEILHLSEYSSINFRKLITRRRKAFILVKDQRRVIEIFGYPAQTALRTIQQTEKRSSQSIRGVSGYSGLIRGRVKIIRSPSDFSTFRVGDILVAPMTSTDFVPIMKRAAAFVTDEGGLASHAAVIAREYKKPCIVGTLIATRILRDGDRVEVDATKGIVRKL